MFWRALVPYLFLSLASIAWSALPPLSPEGRTAQAEAIVTATVVDATKTLVGEGEHIDEHITLSVTVDSLEKGSPEEIGTTLEIQCWQLAQRPNGWSGNAGHSDIPVEESRFKAWLTKNPEGKWTPLLPNGIEILTSPTVHELGKEVDSGDPPRGFSLPIFHTLIVIAILSGITILLIRAQGSPSTR